MKRDMDLIRNLLFEIEAKTTPNHWERISVEGYNDLEISYHIKLLVEAGLIEAIDLSSKNEFMWKPISLTWEGHDFLDAIRDNSIWKKAKSAISRKLPSVPFEILKSVISSIISRELQN